MNIDRYNAIGPDRPLGDREGADEEWTPEMVEKISDEEVKNPVDEPKQASEQPEDATVPIPATDTATEHNRVRDSNDRDQQIERDGGASRHNEGYDEAADGREQTPAIDRIVDEP